MEAPKKWNKSQHKNFSNLQWWEWLEHHIPWGVNPAAWPSLPHPLTVALYNNTDGEPFWLSGAKFDWWAEPPTCPASESKNDVKVRSPNFGTSKCSQTEGGGIKACSVWQYSVQAPSWFRKAFALKPLLKQRGKGQQWFGFGCAREFLAVSSLEHLNPAGLASLSIDRCEGKSILLCAMLQCT